MPANKKMRTRSTGKSTSAGTKQTRAATTIGGPPKTCDTGTDDEHSPDIIVRSLPGPDAGARAQLMWALHYLRVLSRSPTESKRVREQGMCITSRGRALRSACTSWVACAHAVRLVCGIGAPRVLPPPAEHCFFREVDPAALVLTPCPVGRELCAATSLSPAIVAEVVTMGETAWDCILAYTVVQSLCASPAAASPGLLVGLCEEVHRLRAMCGDGYQVDQRDQPRLDTLGAASSFVP